MKARSRKLVARLIKGDRVGIKWAKTYAANVRSGELEAVKELQKTKLKTLKNIDAQKEALLANTRAFVAGKTANHALLWGEMGCGKSSLVRAVFLKYKKRGLRLIEIATSELKSLYKVLKIVRKNSKFRFIIFCDDFSFEASDGAVNELKSLLEGNIEAPPKNAIFYATSNAKHLVRSVNENSQNYLIQRENDRQNLSLADRFGLQLSFYELDINEYINVVKAYFYEALSGDGVSKKLKEKYSDEYLNSEPFRAAALSFATSKGGVRSPRSALQFLAYCRVEAI